MKNPIRTEAEAFSFVLVVAALAVAVALAAVLGGTWVALGVFLALALGVTVGIYMKSEPKVREPAVWERGRGDRKLLVVANETVAGRALRSEILHRARGRAVDVFVVVPALNTRLRHWTSDEDRARAEARERVERSLAALREAGARPRPDGLALGRRAGGRGRRALHLRRLRHVGRDVDRVLPRHEVGRHGRS